MAVILRDLRVNDPKVIEVWLGRLERQKADIMRDAAQRVAEIDREFSELVRLSEDHNTPLGLPDGDEQKEPVDVDDGDHRFSKDSYF